MNRTISGARPLDLDVYVRTEVFDVARQLQFYRVRINEWPEGLPLAQRLLTRIFARICSFARGSMVINCRNSCCIL